MRGESMRRFWDERAREDALYFVDNRIQYGGERASDADFWQGGRLDLGGILHALEMSVGPEDHVVEIGCGVGRLTRVLAEQAGSVTAVDVSAEMLERARAANPGVSNVDWILGDGESLAGVPDGSADVVFSHVVFQHIPDPAITLGYVREIGRVLRPGGVAGFQVSNDPAVHRPRGGRRAADRLRALLGRAPKGQTHPAWLGSAVDLAQLRVAAGHGGTEVERVVGVGTQYCLVRLRKARGTG